jgi:hypothetical protein
MSADLESGALPIEGGRVRVAVESYHIEPARR